MIHFITGGERSGKSGYAESLALGLTDCPVYLATARCWEGDGEFRARIDRHRASRDARWATIEEPMEISKALPENRVAVIDCVTLWLTNYLELYHQDVDQSLKAARQEFDRLVGYEGTIFIISNELGMGLHAHSKVGRDFVSLQGWMNQHIAKAADRVSFMVSGIPIRVK